MLTIRNSLALGTCIDSRVSLESCATTLIEVWHLARCLLSGVLDNPIRQTSRVRQARVVRCAHQMGLVEQRRAQQLATLAKIDHAVNAKVFSDILDLDDDEDQNFSRSLVSDFITLAKTTINEMDNCL